MAKDKPQSTREEIKASIGDISQFEIMHNQILVGIYMRGEGARTLGGIILPDSNLAEDKWQGKVGLVLRKGPLAFRSDNQTDFAGQDVNEGDWLVYRVSDGFSIDINGVHCRLLQDTDIKGRVPDPSMIY